MCVCVCVCVCVHVVACPALPLSCASALVRFLAAPTRGISISISMSIVQMSMSIVHMSISEQTWRTPGTQETLACSQHLWPSARVSKLVCVVADATRHARVRILVHTARNLVFGACGTPNMGAGARSGAQAHAERIRGGHVCDYDLLWTYSDHLGQARCFSAARDQCRGALLSSPSTTPSVYTCRHYGP